MNRAALGHPSPAPGRLGRTDSTSADRSLTKMRGPQRCNRHPRRETIVTCAIVERLDPERISVMLSLAPAAFLV
jgi:hypothetical protein